MAGLSPEGEVKATITTRWYINSGDGGGGNDDHRNINGAVAVLVEIA